MKVGIVVGDFPVLSESFIVRMIEGIYEKENVILKIIVLGVYDEAMLRWISKDIWESIGRGKVEVVSFRESRLGSFKEVKLLKLYKSLLLVLKNPFGVIKALKHGIRMKNILKSLCFYSTVKDLEDVDLYHGQFLNISLLICVAKIFGIEKSVPVFSSIRGFDITQRRVLSERELYYLNNHLSMVLPVSCSLMSAAKKRGLTNVDMEVLYSGLSISDFLFRLPSSLRNKSQISLTQVGRLVEKKGIELSVLMLSRMAHGYDLAFNVVGDGPLRDKVESEAKKLGVFPKIKFWGAMSHSDTIRLISDSDILVVPSKKAKNGDSEGIPNVIKEAMLLGVIVVASNHSGIPEIIEHGRTGYIFSEDDLNSYCHTIDAAISSEGEWDNIAANARKFVENNFDSKIVLTRLCALYNSRVNYP